MDERQEWLNRQRQRWQSPPAPPSAPAALERCDQIVNTGMGEPTECGRTWPCDYHAASNPEWDTERLRQAWWNLCVTPPRDDARRWEPDRYNAGPFLQEVMAEYARLQEQDR